MNQDTTGVAAALANSTGQIAQSAIQAAAAKETSQSNQSGTQQNNAGSKGNKGNNGGGNNGGGNNGGGGNQQNTPGLFSNGSAPITFTAATQPVLYEIIEDAHDGTIVLKKVDFAKWFSYSVNGDVKLKATANHPLNATWATPTPSR